MVAGWWEGYLPVPSLLHPAVHRSGQRDAHTGRGSECQEGRSVGSVVRSLAHSPALAGGECKERSFDSDVSSLLVAKNRMEMCMNYLHWSDIQILMTLTFRYPYSSSCLSYCPFGIVAVTHTNTLSLLLMAAVELSALASTGRRRRRRDGRETTTKRL